MCLPAGRQTYFCDLVSSIRAIVFDIAGPGLQPDPAMRSAHRSDLCVGNPKDDQTRAVQMAATQGRGNRMLEICARFLSSH